MLFVGSIRTGAPSSVSGSSALSLSVSSEVAPVIDDDDTGTPPIAENVMSSQPLPLTWVWLTTPPFAGPVSPLVASATLNVSVRSWLVAPLVSPNEPARNVTV